MHLAIVQTAEASAEDFLVKLEALLPASVVARAELTDVALTPDAPLPRIIARTLDVTEDELAAGHRVMEKIGAPHFEIRGLDVADAVVPAALEDRPDPWAQGPLAASTDEDEEAKAVLERVINANPSGIDFPEKSYKKAERVCYEYIVKELGKAPLDDQGDTLYPGMVRAIDKPRNPRYIKASWDAVVEHLEAEILYFKFAADWFSDTGHLRVLYRDRTVFDYDFVRKLSTDYGLLEDKLEISLSLDVAVALAAKAVGEACGPAGWAIGFLWTLTKQMGHLPNGALKGQIAALHNDVAKEFGVSIRIAETAHVSLCADWGNLQAFGAMVDTARITWPKDASPIRRAHAKSFHLEALKALMNLKSKLETYKSSGFATTFGVIMESELLGAATNEVWDAKRGYYCMKSQKGSCDRDYRYVFFLGRKDCAFIDRQGWSCHPGRLHKIALANKVFGTAGTDDDPELGVDPKMLKDAKIRKSLGFVLAEKH